MSSFLNKLNLRPNELRLVVVVASVVLVVLYVLSLSPVQRVEAAPEAKKATWSRRSGATTTEIDRDAAYQKELAELQGERAARRYRGPGPGHAAHRQLPGRPARRDRSTATLPARAPPAGWARPTPSSRRHTGTINFVAEESALVNFLYALSSGNSLIRVSSMTLNPDQPHEAAWAT